MHRICIERKDAACHNLFQKYRNFGKIWMLDFRKFKFHDRLQSKPDICKLFWDKLLHSSKTLHICLNIFADTEPCIKYGNFGIWFCEWSKLNTGANFLPHFLPNYGVSIGKPSYTMASSFKNPLWMICSKRGYLRQLSFIIFFFNI